MNFTDFINTLTKMVEIYEEDNNKNLMVYYGDNEEEIIPLIEALHLTIAE